MSKGTLLCSSKSLIVVSANHRISDIWQDKIALVLCILKLPCLHTLTNYSSIILVIKWNHSSHSSVVTRLTVSKWICIYLLIKYIYAFLRPFLLTLIETWRLTSNCAAWWEKTGTRCRNYWTTSLFETLSWRLIYPSRSRNECMMILSNYIFTLSLLIIQLNNSFL